MKTITDQLLLMSEEIKVSVCDLLRKHSGLQRAMDVNNPDSGIVFISVSGDHDWQPLCVEGRQLQSRVRSKYEKLLALLRVLLRSQPSSVHDILSEYARTVYEIVNQEGLTWVKTVDEAISNSEAAIDGQMGLLAGLYDGAENEAVCVPDTNALLYNQRLEDWEFEEYPRFLVILLPTVLSELDYLKVNHRNEEVRRKAEGIIRQIKSYRTRGSLAEGVPLRSGRSTLQTIAIEPNMAKSLPWLKADNNDDAILASLIEIMREHPRCQVMLITRDINLQNKAEYAGLPFVEPPEPLVPPTKQ